MELTFYSIALLLAAYMLHKEVESKTTRLLLAGALLVVSLIGVGVVTVR